MAPGSGAGSRWVSKVRENMSRHLFELVCVFWELFPHPKLET